MNLEKYNLYIIVFILGFIVGCVLCSTTNKNINYTVEKNTTIDSITKVNDSIKLKVEQLDSIKNAKVIEVSSLDNDSTLKLFYELVSE